MLTTLDIQERVRNRCAPDASAALIPKVDYLIETSIPDGLERLGRQVAASAEYKVLQADFTGTPVSGVLSIDTMTPVVAGNAPASILWDWLEKRINLRETADQTNKRTFIRVPRRNAFYSSLSVSPNCVHYYLMGDHKAALKDATGILPGAMGAYVANVTLTASMIPTLANLPQQLEELFISLLTEIVGGKGGGLIARDQTAVAPLTIT